jgi:hypothetical protein
VQLIDEEVEERAIEEELRFALEHDHYMDWCIEMYFKFIHQMKEIMALEVNILNGISKFTLRFVFQSDKDG